LHIFEPRYQQMMKRVLAGSRQFGVLCALDDGSLAPVGTLIGAVCVAII
jgi:Lon protease-like protein